jgi:molybdate transport system substrate-binding protein
MGKVFRSSRRARIVRGAGTAALMVALASCSSATSTTPSSGGATNSPAAGVAPAAGKLSGQLVVFAATSLTAAFDKIGAQFEKANPGVSVKFNYNGSSTLATQIKQGAPADVFASANAANMGTVTTAHLASGTPAEFARNQGEIMVEAGNPHHITSLSQLANPGVKVVLCAPEVPCGSLAEQVFKNAGVTVKPVSEEQNVGGVVTKVSMGEADAGVVYVTDVKSAGSKVTGVPISASENEIVGYPMAQIATAPNPTAATAFMSYVLSPAGQQVLSSYAFMPPK